MAKRNLLPVLLIMLLLTGCMQQRLQHMERYTGEQTRYLRTLWGEEYWEARCYTDGMMELALLGSGYEVGHKTSGIASGFSYETKQTEILEATGDNKVNYKIIEAWAHKAENFRLEDTAPYQYALKQYKKTSEFHLIFPMEEGEEYTFDILGHMEGNKVCIEWMMVYFHEGSQSRHTYSIYENLNYIRSVLEQNEDWNQTVLNIMEGSVDNEGAYISLSITPDAADEYMMPEEGILDDTVLVRIMQYNGDSLNGELQSAVQTHYVEWNSLQHGKHELSVELVAKDGRKKQITVPFTY